MVYFSILTGVRGTFHSLPLIAMDQPAAVYVQGGGNWFYVLN